MENGKSVNALLSTGGAAKHLGVKEDTLRLWRFRNRGPKYIKMEGRVYYDPDHLTEYLESCVYTPGSAA